MNNNVYVYFVSAEVAESYSGGLCNAGNAVALICHTILSFQANTGLHMQQIDALKHGFDGFDTENAGVISPNQMQVIFKMMGNAVQVGKNEADWSIMCCKKFAQL